MSLVCVFGRQPCTNMQHFAVEDHMFAAILFLLSTEAVMFYTK